MIKALEKDKSLSEDESKKHQDEVQKSTDRYIQNIEDINKIKDSEILKV